MTKNSLPPNHSKDPLFLRDEALRQAMDLLFFGYRDFTFLADEHLAKIGYGRAHHRVIYFVGRNSGLGVGELLAILKITKQSLNRVLRVLVSDGYVTQEIGSQDKRRRVLTLSSKGRTLEDQLSKIQSRQIAKAYKLAGPEAVQGFRKVLTGMIINQNDINQYL